MAHDQDQNIGFLCVSYRLGPFLGFEKVKAIFCDIPSDQFKRIAYAARLDDTERATLKNALTNYPEAESVIDSFVCNALVREIGSDPCIESRSKRVLREVNSFKARRLHVQLDKAHVAGIDEWSKEIENYYENKNQFPDFYIEGRYALALQKSGMRVKMKPYRHGGPDLQVSTGCLSFDVEVTRFIQDTCLENELDMSSDVDNNPLLIPMPDKSFSVCSKIEDKIQQLKEDRNGIILLHSDNIGIDYIEFAKKAQYIASLGEKLSAVIFVDSWTTAKVVPHSSARIPPHELNRVLQRIVGTITQPAYDWAVDLQRMCDEHEHQYH